MNYFLLETRHHSLWLCNNYYHLLICYRYRVVIASGGGTGGGNGGHMPPPPPPPPNKNLILPPPPHHHHHHHHHKLHPRRHLRIAILSALPNFLRVTFFLNIYYFVCIMHIIDFTTRYSNLFFIVLWKTH